MPPIKPFSSKADVLHVVSANGGQFLSKNSPEVSAYGVPVAPSRGSSCPPRISSRTSIAARAASAKDPAPSAPGAASNANGSGATPASCAELLKSPGTVGVLGLIATEAVISVTSKMVKEVVSSVANAMPETPNPTTSAEKGDHATAAGLMAQLESHTNDMSTYSKVIAQNSYELRQLGLSPELLSKLDTRKLRSLTRILDSRLTRDRSLGLPTDADIAVASANLSEVLRGIEIRQLLRECGVQDDALDRMADGLVRRLRDQQKLDQSAVTNLSEARDWLVASVAGPQTLGLPKRGARQRYQLLVDCLHDQLLEAGLDPGSLKQMQPSRLNALIQSIEAGDDALELVGDAESTLATELAEEARKRGVSVEPSTASNGNAAEPVELQMANPGRKYQVYVIPPGTTGRAGGHPGDRREAIMASSAAAIPAGGIGGSGSDILPPTGGNGGGRPGGRGRGSNPAPDDDFGASPIPMLLMALGLYAVLVPGIVQARWALLERRYGRKLTFGEMNRYNMWWLLARASKAKEPVMEAAEKLVAASMVTPSTIAAREQVASVGSTVDTPPPSGGNPLVALAKLLLPIGAFTFVLFHHGGEGIFDFDDGFKAQARQIADDVMAFLRSQGLFAQPGKAKPKEEKTTKVAGGTRDVVLGEQDDAPTDLPGDAEPPREIQKTVWDHVSTPQGPPSLSRWSTASKESRDSRKSFTRKNSGGLFRRKASKEIEDKVVGTQGGTQSAGTTATQADEATQNFATINASGDRLGQQGGMGTGARAQRDVEVGKTGRVQGGMSDVELLKMQEERSELISRVASYRVQIEDLLVNSTGDKRLQAELRKQLTEAHQGVANTQAQVAQLQDALRRSENEKDASELRNQRLDAEIAKQMKDIEKLVEQRSELQTSHANARKEAEELSETIKSQTLHLESMQKELALSTAEAADARAQVTATKGQLEDAEARLQQQEERNVELGARLADSRAQTQESNERLEAALAGRAALEADIRERLAVLSQHTQELASTEHQLKELNTADQELVREMVAEISSELQIVREKYAAAEQLIKREADARSAAESRAKHLQTVAEGQMARADKEAAQVASLATQIGTLEEQVDKLQAAEKRHERNAQLWEAERVELVEKVTALTASLDGVREEAQAAMKQVEELQQRHAGGAGVESHALHSRQSSQGHVTLDEPRQSLDWRVDQMIGEVEQTRVQLEAAKKRAGEYERDLDDLRKQHELLELARGELTGSVETLEFQLTDALDQLGNAQEELVYHREALNEAQASLLQYKDKLIAEQHKHERAAGDLERQLAQKDIRLEQYSNEVSALYQQTQAQHRQIMEAEEKLAELESLRKDAGRADTQREEAQMAAAAAKSEARDVKGQLTVLQAANEAVAARKTALESEVVALRKRLSERESDLHAVRDELEATTTQIEMRQESKGSDAAQWEGKVAKLSADLGTKERENAKLTAQLSLINRESGRRESALTDRERRLDKLGAAMESQTSALRAEVEASRQEASAATAALAAARQELDEVHKQLQDARAEAAIQMRDHEQEVAAAQEIAQEAQLAAAEAKAEVADMVAAHAASTRALEEQLAAACAGKVQAEEQLQAYLAAVPEELERCRRTSDDVAAVLQSMSQLQEETSTAERTTEQRIAQVEAEVDSLGNQVLGRAPQRAANDAGRQDPKKVDDADAQLAMEALRTEAAAAAEKAAAAMEKAAAAAKEADVQRDAAEKYRGEVQTLQRQLRSAANETERRRQEVNELKKSLDDNAGPGNSETLLKLQRRLEAVSGTAELQEQLGRAQVIIQQLKAENSQLRYHHAAHGDVEMPLSQNNLDQWLNEQPYSAYALSASENGEAYTSTSEVEHVLSKHITQSSISESDDISGLLQHRKTTSSLPFSDPNLAVDKSLSVKLPPVKLHAANRHSTKELLSPGDDERVPEWVARRSSMIGHDKQQRDAAARGRKSKAERDLAFAPVHTRVAMFQQMASIGSTSERRVERVNTLPSSRAQEAVDAAADAPLSRITSAGDDFSAQGQ